MNKGSIAYIDDPNKSRHGESVKIIEKIDDYYYKILRKNKEEKINYSYLVTKEPILIGDTVSLIESHWEKKAKKGEKVKVLKIEWNEHLASRSYCARWTYYLETKNGEKIYMDDYQVKK